MNLGKEIFELELKDIMPNRFQPREVFDDSALEELSQSIKEHGVIQPIVVRKVGDKYEIIAGERRYRASLLAGKETIPAIVSPMDDREAAKVALIENLQRKDLSAIEEAKTYQTILKLDNMTQEELAQNLGKSQSAIANKLRLLNLDDEVQTALLNGEISERHARSLLNLPTNEAQRTMLNKIIENRLTVRQLDEEIANQTGKIVDDDIEGSNGGGQQVQLNSLSTPTINSSNIGMIDEKSADIQNTNFTIPEEHTNQIGSINNTIGVPEANINNYAFPASDPTPYSNVVSDNSINFDIPENNNENVNKNEISNNIIGTEPVREERIQQFPDFQNNNMAQQAITENITIADQSNDNGNIGTNTFEQNIIGNINQNTDNNTIENTITPVIEEVPNTLNIEDINGRPTETTNEILSKDINMQTLDNTSLNAITEPEPEQFAAQKIEQSLDEPKLSNVNIPEQSKNINNNANISSTTATPNIFESLRINELEKNDEINPVINTPNESPIKYDMRFAINNFRQAVQNTEKFGFKVEVAEVDLENSHQIIINIMKNKDE